MECASGGSGGCGRVRGVLGEGSLRLAALARALDVAQSWRCLPSLMGPWSPDSRHWFAMTLLSIKSPPRAPSFRLMPARGPLKTQLPTKLVSPASARK